jgi:microcystin-dependent protein
MAYEPFIGEVCEYAFDFAPIGWADCAGQTLDISHNQALFSLLGTRYGGDGVRTFNLPDLRPFKDTGPDYGKKVRVDWRELGMPRKCIALQGIFPSRP